MANKNPVLKQIAVQGTYNTNVNDRVLKTVQDYIDKNPEKRIFMMGWGYTSQPLSPGVVQRLIDASQKLGDAKTYTSYEEISGNSQLRTAICDYYFKKSSVKFDETEVFVTDGGQSALVNALELFSHTDSVAIQNPWYPAFIEGTLLSGRTDFIELKCLEQEGFVPQLPDQRADIIYLCSPNNPTGAVLTRQQLQSFVDYALDNDSIIIFDAVYTRFIRHPDIPRSIYEIEGAKSCAIEVDSLSKMANFTGLRLGWVVMPEALRTGDSAPGELQKMWQLRNAIKFWGASNLVQQAAIAALSDQGQKECDEIITYYMENARLLKQGLQATGLTCYGGEHNPYIWLKAPAEWSSDKFFKSLIYKIGLVGIPGNFFGSQGEGFLRLSTLGNRDEIEAAVSVLSQHKSSLIEDLFQQS